MIYLDGSALCRFLPGVRHYEAFGVWARDHADELVTTQLGFTELRQAAELYPRSAAERVQGVVDLVRAGVAVIQFSDDNVAISSHATAVLKPFAALHVGAAVDHEKVDTIVTYDPALANVAVIYDLAVVSPGLPEDWYLEYEGPSEHWKPVALDAPYAPGAEFDMPEVIPKVDAYERALREAEAEAEAEAKAALAAAPVGETQAGEASVVAEAPAVGQPASEASEFEQALREAEAAALAAGNDGTDESDLGWETGEDAEAAAEATANAELDDAGQPRIGVYRPRVEAWRAGDDDGGDPALEPGGESGALPPPRQEPSGGGGLPWSQQPEPAASAPEALRTSAPEALRTSAPEPAAPAPEKLPAPAPDSVPAPAQAVDGSLVEVPLALAPAAPSEHIGVPNLPREERGVPPVTHATRDSIGSPSRRPMFDTEPHPDSRASRPPEPVPPVPPEESKPLTVPIKWNVELDAPEAYAPTRIESDRTRALPAFPVSFAGGQGGLTLQSPGSVSVPALEPSGPARSAFPLDEAILSPTDQPAGSAAPSARHRKAAEKAAKKERERIEKLAKKAKGSASYAPAQAPQAPALPAPGPASAPTPGAAEAWKLDDVVSLGKRKEKGS